MYSPTRNRLVYVVDDDMDVLGSLRFLLEADSFEVRTFRSGIELAKRLRGRDVAAPIILITGYPDVNISGKAAAAGIDHVLLKPHLQESLVVEIRRAIRETQPLSH